MRELTFNQFSSYPRKIQMEILEKFIDNLDEKFLEGVIIKGHSNELHSEQSERELLSRTMRDGKASSTFDSATELSWNIKENLFFLVPKIVDWLTVANGPMSNSEFMQKTFDIPIMAEGNYDSKYCKGLTTDLELKETKMAKLVLARNLDIYTQEGKFFFYVKTVYPDLTHPEAKSLGRNLREEAKEMYENGVPYKGIRKPLPELRKAYWAFKFVDCKPFTYTGLESDKLIVPFKINNQEFSATFDSNSENFVTPIMSVNVGKDKPHYIPIKKAELDSETYNKAMIFGKRLMDIYKFSIYNKSANNLIAQNFLGAFDDVDYRLRPLDYSRAKHQVKSSFEDFALAK